MKLPLAIRLLLAALVVAHGLSPLDVSAETTSKASWTARPISGAIFYVGMPLSFFDKDAAVREGVAERGLGFALGASVFFYRFFLLGLEYGGDLPGDEMQFTNMTTVGELSSSIYINQVSFYGGLKTPRIRLGERRKWSLLGSLSGGVMLAFGEARRIGNCIDCDEQNLSIDGGAFLEPEAYIGYSFLALGFGYRHLFGSDYNGRLQLKLAILLDG